jgi:nucleoredoxin
MDSGRSTRQAAEGLYQRTEETAPECYTVWRELYGFAPIKISSAGLHVAIQGLMKRWIALPLLLLVLSLEAASAPMTFKELEFLVRQRTPEAEVTAQVQKRRLMAPIDAAGLQALKQSGASEDFLKAVSAPELVLSPAEAGAEKQRQLMQKAEAARSLAEDAAAAAALDQYRRKLADVNASRGKMADILDGKLVKLSGDQLVPVSARDLAHVRVFGLYHSAMWCGPCRQFTPKLVAAYKRLKQEYGDQFELILVSHDRDEFNMQKYMKADEMPWPAVRFGTQIEQLKRFSPDGIPWLVAINSAGEPMTKNGVDKQYIDPNAILGAIEELLAKGMR